MYFHEVGAHLCETLCLILFPLHLKYLQDFFSDEQTSCGYVLVLTVCVLF